MIDELNAIIGNDKTFAFDLRITDNNICSIGISHNKFLIIKLSTVKDNSDKGYMVLTILYNIDYIKDKKIEKRSEEIKSQLNNLLNDYIDRHGTN